MGSGALLRPGEPRRAKKEGTITFAGCKYSPHPISCPYPRRKNGYRKTAGLAAEAVDQTTLQPEVVLRSAVKVSVKVVDLDGTQRNVARQGDIGTAADGRRESVARARAETGKASGEAFSTD